MADVRSQVEELAIQPGVRQLLDRMASLSPSTIAEALELQRIPAPTFEESQRSSYVLKRFQEMGLSDVSTDDLYVVYGRIPGSDPNAPAVLASAHLDTVFPADTDLSVRRRGPRLYGPGLGDNSIGVAGILALADLLQAHDPKPPADIWLVGTVCEEGLGNLRGMQRALEKLGESLGLVVVIEGMALGHVFHRGLGVRRLRVSLHGPGGHSWLNPDRPSAVHSLLRLGASLSRVEPPSRATSTLNIGLVEGGTSINTIAPDASLSIDLRSESAAALKTLERRVLRTVERYKRPERITINVEMIGDRPAGSITRDHPLVQASRAALGLAGIRQVAYEAASTGANLPLANGLPAVCVGLTTGGNAHGLDEFIETKPVATGMQQLLLLVLAAAHHSSEWSMWDNVG